MASDVDIANSALDELGEQTILSFADTSPAGRIAARNYASLRDAMLEEFNWNFAIKRTSLAADPVAPEFEFEFAYQQPADLLRLISLNNESDLRWRNESGKILTNLEAPLEITYVARVLEGNFPATFREALSARLALKWAMPLTQTRGIRDDMSVLARRTIARAKITDSQTDNKRRIITNDFIQARFGVRRHG